MKKNGFTLIELLGVIVILSLLLVLALPKVTSSIKNSTHTIDSKTEEIIYKAMDLYIENHEVSFSRVSGNTYCVRLSALVEDGYLKDPININDENITKNYSVKVDYTNNYDYSIVDNLSCSNNYKYIGDYYTFVVPEDGYYNIELWGAQGGTVDNAIGGKGAYTQGYISLSKGEIIYIYVGGTSTNYVGGYNGGGSGGVYTTDTSNEESITGGGGATDIRLISGKWSDINSLRSRIMVAAGGGGAYSYSSSYQVNGGAGGALIGENGISTSNDYIATGGTQTSGGKGSGYTEYNGSFGKGGNSDTTNASGGGSGWYGGGATMKAGSSSARSGAGGSSFISGFAGVNAISSNGLSTDNVQHFSNKYFIGSSMQSGINEGNGKAKITYVGSEMNKTKISLNNVKYIKSCIQGSENRVVEIQAIYKGENVVYSRTVTDTDLNTLDTYSYAVDGKIDNVTSTSGYAINSDANGEEFCLVVKLAKTYDLDEIAVWNYWLDERVYTNFKVSVSSDGTEWETVIEDDSSETSLGHRVNVYR